MAVTREGMMRNLDRARQLGKITEEQYQSAIRFRIGLDSPERGKGGTLQTRSAQSGTEPEGKREAQPLQPVTATASSGSEPGPALPSRIGKDRAAGAEPDEEQEPEAVRNPPPEDDIPF